MSKDKVKEPGFFGQYFKAVRFYMATGLMVCIPLIVTVWLTWWLFKNVGMGIENLIQDGYLWLNKLGGRVDRLGFLSQFEYRKGFGFLLSVALFLATGILARNLVGQRIIRMFERQIGRVPVLNRVYKAVRQIRDVFVNRDGAVFQEVCMVEYPRKGVYAMGFITSHEQGLVQKALGKELIAVFVPTTPNPTSGFLLYMPKDEIKSLEVSVEEAMKLIISAGAYIPGDHDDDGDVAVPVSPVDSV